MKILVGCECSGRVAASFASLGAYAISCDLKLGEMGAIRFKNGGRYEHIQADVFDVIEREDWDLGIFHPPCTFIAVSSMAWINSRFYPTRRDDMKAGVSFAKALWNSGVKRIAMENPISVLSTHKSDGYFPDIGKPTQIINPWQFGDSFHKPTCLWLKNLPALVPTNIVDRGEFLEYESKVKGKHVRRAKWNSVAKTNDLESTRSIRSRTFPGIANAMATQWTNYILNANQLFEV